jgi:hypothetical protein
MPAAHPASATRPTRKSPVPPRAIHETLRAFAEFGQQTRVRHQRFPGHTLMVCENEFWTSKQRACHSLQEVSYRACFKPQLPGFFITRFCGAGDVVYDPFMGRGTTLIEARLLGRAALGNDANPLSKILAGPRLDPPSLPMVTERLGEIRLSHHGETDHDLLVFFHPRTLDELYGWRQYFLERKTSGKFDRTDAWIQMVASNRLTGHSPGFFSVYTLPPNQATSVKAQRKINEKRNQRPEWRDTKALILRKSRQLLKDPLPAGFGDPAWRIFCASADKTPMIAADSVGLVVTSPPFLDNVDYVGDNWLRAWFCGVEIGRGSIWQVRSIEDWVARMAGVFAELRRILRPGGLVAFEVGEVRKGTVELERQVLEAGLRAGLEPECLMINVQNFTKTANCWGVANNRMGTNSNRIVIFRKTA